MQLLQAALNLAALALFLAVAVPPAWKRRGRRMSLGVVLLPVFFDPVIAHHNLSILTDSLALSASLVFCAALMALGSWRRRRGLAAVLLLASIVTAGTLRVEKSVVMLAATALTLLSWWRWPPPGWLAFGPRPRRLLLLGILGIASLAFATTQRIQSAFHEPSNSWPPWMLVAHYRLVYPHLTSIYEALPQDVRNWISPEWTEHYDSRMTLVHSLMDQVAGGKPERLERLTRKMARTAVHERGAEIALDCARDSLENLLPTAPFYARLGLWRLLGEERYQRLSPSDGTPSTYQRLAAYRPRLSAAYTGAAGLLFFAAAGCVLVRRARGTLAKGPTPAQLRTWVPVAAFCGLNALAFGFRADLTLIRYTLAAHAVALIFVYALCLAPPCAPAADTAAPPPVRS